MKTKKTFVVTYDLIVKREFNQPVEIERNKTKKVKAETFSDARTRIRDTYKYDVMNLRVAVAK